MPKVVSKSQVSSSIDAKPTPSSAATLRVYYCICGEFNLVIDKTLAALPRRQTDGATIVQTQDNELGAARVFKLNAKPNSEPVLLKRPEGYERRYSFACPRCTLPIAYQTAPPPVKSNPYLYILSGALSQAQGQIPLDAFEGEETAEGMDQQP
ncbi:hypothetical protein MIND_00745600 [Mycena indigotica]|uniref:STEEP1 domain-containing protein n=1 Tax=Mycena indigotica TaxID=2126181 RepID=A0A8H6W184_9AGAR|nr:uncharacterized protein MIND_00745600 [Mycena indigotica]KAF7301799.1 hypothetical protein MIND_00745600 [Mycena indigotica]